MARLKSGIIMLVVGLAFLAASWAAGMVISPQQMLELTLAGADLRPFLVLDILRSVAVVSGLILTVLGIRRVVRRTEPGRTIDIP